MEAARREIPFGKPLIGDEERRAVARVLEGTILTHGPSVKAFEAAMAAYTGAPHAIGTASATASLHLAYFCTGIGPGDEVLVPAQTHVATAHAVELVGARAVFVDSDPTTGNIDLGQLEAMIGPRTRAISVVHYLGLPVDMRRVMELARRHDLLVVEDCALGLGSSIDGTHVGRFGDLGCFSFYPVKHITTGEGGMTITRRADLAALTSTRRAFGIDRNIVQERAIPGVYDVQELGLNYRLTELGAAMGVEQMKRLPGFLERRRRNHQLLSRLLREIDGIEILAEPPPGFVTSWYCHLAILSADLAPQRSEIVDRLKARGVGTSIYYPRPVPHMTWYRQKYGFRDDQFPQASRLSYRGIALPVGPHLDEEDMAYIAESLRQALAGTRRP